VGNRTYRKTRHLFIGDISLTYWGNGSPSACVFRKCGHYERVTADEALSIARAAAEADRLRFSRHALERMQERTATHADVRQAVRTCDVAVPSEDGPNRWKLCGGGDLDDCELRVVVAIDDEGEVIVTVVTVHPQ
jgi:hypothetical protein